ncbi:MAG: hypothetical protein ACI81T_002368, partial [Bacteroidia bacterium]
VKKVCRSGAMPNFFAQTSLINKLRQNTHLFIPRS